MSKYFSLFQTEAQYQAAKDNLDYPNVSLIDTTGDLHYAKFTGKTIADAAFGDIILYNTTSSSLENVSPSSYNSNDYPTNNYTPIAICIFDKNSRSDKKTVFISLKWMDFEAPETGTYNPKDVFWGDSTRIGYPISELADSKTINDAIKLITTASWESSSTIPNSVEYGNYPSFECCWRYHTPGTSAGDWMLPSIYDLSKMATNMSTIKNSFNIINGVVGEGVIWSPGYCSLWTANEHGAEMARGYFSNDFTDLSDRYEMKYTYGYSALAVFYAGVEEL